MGPALETFLTALLFGLMVSLLLGAATRPFWRRIYRYFKRWYERDMRLEEQARAEQKQRAQARRELSEFCHDEESLPQRADGNAGDAVMSEKAAPCRAAETPETQQATESMQQGKLTETHAEVHIGGDNTGA